MSGHQIEGRPALQHVCGTDFRLCWLPREFAAAQFGALLFPAEHGFADSLMVFSCDSDPEIRAAPAQSS